MGEYCFFLRMLYVSRLFFIVDYREKLSCCDYNMDKLVPILQLYPLINLIRINPKVCSWILSMELAETAHETWVFWGVLLLRNELNYHSLPLKKWLISGYDIYSGEFFSHYRRRLYIVRYIEEWDTRKIFSSPFWIYSWQRQVRILYQIWKLFVMCQVRSGAFVMNLTLM